MVSGANGNGAPGPGTAPHVQHPGQHSNPRNRMTARCELQQHQYDHCPENHCPITAIGHWKGSQHLNKDPKQEEK